MKAEPSSVEEVVPNMAYGQPHNVRKYPSHLAQNQQDSFEYPYARQKQQNYPQMPPVGYPQYPQGYPQYQPNYGKKRRKRKASSSKYEQFDAHSGIHRIMSTGMKISIIENCAGWVYRTVYQFFSIFHGLFPKIHAFFSLNCD